VAGPTRPSFPTRRSSDLVVVGDRGFWVAGGGVPEAVAETAATGTAEADAEAVPSPLLRALDDLSAEVETDAVVAGYRVDLCVTAPGGRVLVLVDRTRDGRGLRRLLDRQQRLREVTDLPVLRVPLWRCLHDPADLAKEVLLGMVCRPVRGPGRGDPVADGAGRVRSAGRAAHRGHDGEEATARCPRATRCTGWRSTSPRPTAGSGCAPPVRRGVSPTGRGGSTAGCWARPRPTANTSSWASTRASGSA